MKINRILVLGALFTFFSFCSNAYAGPVSDQDAIRIIVGEAGGQGLKGMICVGEVLRNRGSTKGFYGATRLNLSKQPASAWKTAAKAWELSKHTNYTKGANHFENVRSFGVPRWAKDCIKTYEYRGHVFYKEIR